MFRVKSDYMCRMQVGCTLCLDPASFPTPREHDSRLICCLSSLHRRRVNYDDLSLCDDISLTGAGRVLSIGDSEGRREGHGYPERRGERRPWLPRAERCDAGWTNRQEVEVSKRRRRIEPDQDESVRSASPQVIAWALEGVRGSNR